MTLEAREQLKRGRQREKEKGGEEIVIVVKEVEVNRKGDKEKRWQGDVYRESSHRIHFL